jgi:hypothetical protein
VYITWTKEEALYTILFMAEMPKQSPKGHADLIMKIERARRLAREVPDELTSQRLLALATEYEKQLDTQK